MLSPNLAEPGPETWASFPAAFEIVLDGVAVDHRRIKADFEPLISTGRKRFRIVRPGALLAGYEERRRFSEPIPRGLRLEQWRVTEILSPTWRCVAGLVAGEPVHVPLEPGLGGRGTVALPQLFDIGGGLTGLPEASESPLPFVNAKRALSERGALWAVVEHLLASGFTVENLDVFASDHARVLRALHVEALELVQTAHAAFAPRVLDSLMRSLAGRLKGFSKVDASSPFVVQLFGEAVSEAVTQAAASELPALLARLIPSEAASAAGGGCHATA